MIISCDNFKLLLDNHHSEEIRMTFTKTMIMIMTLMKMKMTEKMMIKTMVKRRLLSTKGGDERQSGYN